MLRGMIVYTSNGEEDELLGVVDESTHCVEKLAEWAQERFGWQRRRQQVSVRYWTAEQALAPEAIKRAAVESMLGSVEADYGARYSDVTGYLWTDEVFTVGGHNLIHELSSHAGEFLHLEIDVH